MDLRSQKNHAERRKAVENKLDVSLATIGKTLCDDEESIHCENLIGAVGMPVGIAGPVIIHGQKKHAAYIPLATTEGALVASVARGCKVINASGGVTVLVDSVGVTRGPIFEVKNIREGHTFCAWLLENKKALASVAQGTSNHLILKDMSTAQQGRYVYVRFQFDTDQAMGMNMATIATTAIAEYIEKSTPYTLLAVAGNFDTDKKPSWLNMI